ncbi:MAG: hypothetical protein SFV19_01445 [Rhodospirillaceae bacterium]|nr:hypothetical protein [Rhodospirillaceae bacterium]
MAEVTKPAKTINGKETFAADYFKSDTGKQVWLDNPHIDNLVSVSVALGAEIWALKQRQIISEKLAEQKVFPTTAAIEGYKPSKQEEEDWDAERQGLAKRVYGWFARETVATPSTQADK